MVSKMVTAIKLNFKLTSTALVSRNATIATMKTHEGCDRRLVTMVNVVHMMMEVQEDDGRRVCAIENIVTNGVG